MITKLADSKCEACNSGTPRLDEGEAEKLRSQLDPSWTVSGEHLRREWKTADFVSAFSKATAIALLAQDEGHHPDLDVGWGHLTCDLTTHAIKGLSRNDFVMAAKIDALGP